MTATKNDMPINSSQEKTRKVEIREKARDIFIRHGYRKTTIEDIGKACGLGKAALYHYFTNKEEIIAEVTRHENELLLNKMRLAVNEVENPRDKLLALVNARLQFMNETCVECKELSEILPMVAHLRQVYFQEEMEIIRKILEEGLQRGVFKPVNLQTAPLILISSLRGIEIHFSEVKNTPELKDGLNELMELFFQGLCVQKNSTHNTLKS